VGRKRRKRTKRSKETLTNIVLSFEADIDDGPDPGRMTPPHSHSRQFFHLPAVHVPSPPFPVLAVFNNSPDETTYIRFDIFFFIIAEIISANFEKFLSSYLF